MWMPNMKNINVIEEKDNNVEETWELTRRTMVTNWPPRSYTCSFCRREFRSAQALGGQMNVHRRDRARLNHQAQVQAQACYPSAGSKPILYQLGNCRNISRGGGSLPTNSSRVINYDEVRVNDMSQEVINKLNHEKQGPNNEELDLELRLGHISAPTSL